MDPILIIGNFGLESLIVSIVSNLNETLIAVEGTGEPVYR